MPLRPSPIGKYRKRGFSSSSKQEPLGHHISPHCSVLESLPNLPVDRLSPISPSPEEEPPASISSLPVELLREIFLWSINHSRQFFDQNSAPLNISHTCSLWRQLAIRTSLLWNVISLDHFEYPAKMIQLWIERANGAPLFINLGTMDATRESPWASDPNIRSTKIIIQHADQWENLRITSSMRQNPVFLELEPQMLQNLKRCIWILTPDIHPAYAAPLTLQSFEHFWTVACSAPLLQDVYLSMIPINAPWSQLITLQLYQTSFGAGIHALSQCSSLKTLRWHLDDKEPLVQLPPLTIPTLTHLSLTCQSSRVFVPLFNALILPNLTCLDLFVWDLCNPIPSEVTKMLSHLNYPLEQFALLAYNPMLDATIIGILLSSCFHHLKRLSLPAITDTTNLCAILSSAANLPMLQELDLGVEQGECHTTLIHALQARRSQSTSGNHVNRVSLNEYKESPHTICFPSTLSDCYFQGLHRFTQRLGYTTHSRRHVCFIPPSPYCFLHLL